MQLSRSLLPISWALGLGLVAASPYAPAPVLQARNAPGLTTRDTLRDIARGLSAVRVEGRDASFKSNKTILDTSWSGATLFKAVIAGSPSTGGQGSASVSVGADIVCQTCYIKGSAEASFTVSGNGNVSDVFLNYTKSVSTEVENITDTVFGQLKDTLEKDAQDIVTLDFGDITFPTFDIDFNVDLPPLPAVSLKFQFDDDFELYMQLDTKLTGGATYTLPLYASKSELGVAIGDDILAGVAVVIDLVLDVQSAIEISSGFHLKLDKGVGMELQMFAQNVSSVDFPGGQFEFLPVVLVGDSTVLKGVLRVTLKAGLQYKSPSVNILGNDLAASAGVSVEVHANVAEFTTNITSPSSGNTDKACDLQVVEKYQFALGAAAGATIAFLGNTWGPVPNTQVPLFYTTLGSACAVRGTASSTTAAATTSPGKRELPMAAPVPRQTPPPQLRARQAANSLTTTTLTSTATYTGQTCMSSGLVNCPASLQATTKLTSVLSLITALPSGATPTFPAQSVASVLSTVPFGTNAQQISQTSGTPTPFTPPPTPSQVAEEFKSWLDGDTNGVSNKIIFGVALGLGIPVLIALISCLVHCCRRRRYAPVPQQAPASGPTIINVGQPVPYTPQYSPTPSAKAKETVTVRTTERY